MENPTQESHSIEPLVPDSKFFMKSISDRNYKNRPYDKNTLKRILKHISAQKRGKNKLSVKGCCHWIQNDTKVDSQVKLRCRQLPNLLNELRTAIMRQDWEEVTTLVMILCQPGTKYYCSIILKVCFILLFSHPNSNFHLLQNFIRLTTDYILEEDINKFIRILFAVRNTSLKPLKWGKYIRKTGDYKVVRDVEFEKL